jgi:hypothetical protein
MKVYDTLVAYLLSQINLQKFYIKYSHISHTEGVLDTTLCGKVCQWLAAGRWFSPGTSVSSTNNNWNIIDSGVKHHNPNPITIDKYKG